MEYDLVWVERTFSNKTQRAVQFLLPAFGMAGEGVGEGMGGVDGDGSVGDDVCGGSVIASDAC